jgi:ABC-2 type transport system permease protein
MDLFLRSIALLLGGVAYPIEVLPEWLRQVSLLLPITYSLSAMRLTLLQGHTLTQVLTDVLALILFAGVLLPAGIFAFHCAVQRVKVTGTLGHY